MDKYKDIEFNWQLEPKELRRSYKSTQFDDAFRKLIAKKVITTLSPQLVPETHNLTYDDSLVYKHLIGPLERFICNLNPDSPQDDVDNVLEGLKNLRQPSRMCRKVLKTGDVLFSCNDCGFDATCVMCIDCFHKSVHKDHNYRMSNTDGGGCCDCGDIEAWKQHPACSDHKATSYQLTDDQDTNMRLSQFCKSKTSILEEINKLPDRGYASRYYLICQATLHYARTMLTWNDFNKLPSYLDVREQLTDSDDSEVKLLENLLADDSSSKNYFTVLFNDEVHTYDQVINTLVKVINCTKMIASITASTISREGRSLILQDQHRPCKHVRDSIAHIRDSGQNPLKVEVIHGVVLAHQAYALKLIEWIQKMSQNCDAFRVLTAHTLLGSYDPIPEQEEINPEDEMTLLERVMLSNTSYWKIARINWNDLFVSTLLTEYNTKATFARLITRLYPKLVQDFIEDDHDHSVSILSMTVQLYTVPSLTRMLIEEENALAIISQTLIDVCRNTKRESDVINFENRNTFDINSLKRGFYIISDLRYLISIVPTDWSEKLRANVVQSVDIFLGLLSSMQGMDSVKRQLGQHIEYEPEWETGMTLQSKLIRFIALLVNYCSLDQQLLISTLQETQKRLFSKGPYKTIVRELFGYTAPCIQYDVSTSPVSVHLPLTRFAAALILKAMIQFPPASEHEPYPEQKFNYIDPTSGKTLSMIEIAEPSLRTQVMIAQFRSGMWRRNGYSLVNQIIYFSGALMRTEMYDRDILVLQELAAMTKSNEFIIHLLNKFNLFNWLLSETTREPLRQQKAYSFTNDEEIMTLTMSLSEEFLQLLITIISERYCVGIGKIQGNEDVIKNEIIQLLCIGPFTRSEIKQKLYVEDNDEIDCIKTVANLKRSSETSTGKYELKPEYYDRFNPFFYHYNRRHQSHALDVQLKRKRTAKESLICCPPPRPVELTASFNNLRELLRCEITLIIIQKILRRTLNEPDSSLECSTKAPIRYQASDLQLDQCLHLIGLGLYEQERSLIEFNFIRVAYEANIFVLLKECYEKAKRSKDLIYWIVQKTNQVLDKVVELLSSNEYNYEEDEKSAHAAIQILLSSILSDSSKSVKQETKQRNSELAAQRRNRIMAMMKAKQEKFLDDPAAKQLAAETTKHEAGSSSSSSNFMSTGTNQQSHTSAAESGVITSQTAEVNTSGNVPDEESVPLMSQAHAQEDKMDTDSIGGGHEHCSTDKNHDDDADDDDVECIGANHLCILCRDEQRVSFDDRTLVLMAYIQRSAVLSKNRNGRRIPNYALTPTNQLKHLHLSQPDAVDAASAASLNPPITLPDSYSFTSDNSWSFDASYMPADLFFGPYISTCGHVMHYECWKMFSDTITKRETSRPSRNSRHVSIELEKNEILCPLCECISNATIPLIPDYTNFIKRQQTALASNVLCTTTKRRISSVFNASQDAIAHSSERLTIFLHALNASVSACKSTRHLKTHYREPTESYLEKYTRFFQPTSINDALKQLDEHEALTLRDFIATTRSEKISSTKCSKSLLKSIKKLTDRIHSVGLDLDKSIYDVHHARVFMMTSWTISYTIQAHERAARFKGTPLFDDLESSKNLCLSSLIRVACASMMTHQSNAIQSLLIEKLRYVLVCEDNHVMQQCCLDIDIFELFVSTFIMLEKLYSHMDHSTSRQLRTILTKLPLPSKESSRTLSQSCPKKPLPPPPAAAAPNRDDDHVLHDHAWTTRAYDHEYYRNLLHLMLILNLLQVVITIQTDDSKKAQVKRERAELAIADNQHTTRRGECIENSALLQASGSLRTIPPNDNNIDESISKEVIMTYNSESERCPPQSVVSGNSAQHDAIDVEMSTSITDTTSDIDNKSATTQNKQSHEADSAVSASSFSQQECHVLHNFYKDIILASGHPNNKLCPPNEQLVKRIKCALLPFLRSCAIFLYQLSHIQPNETLRKQSGFFEGKNFCLVSAGHAATATTTTRSPDDCSDDCNLIEEFNAICQYLDLPNDFTTLLRSKEARNLSLGLLRHTRVLYLIEEELGIERFKGNNSGPLLSRNVISETVAEASTSTSSSSSSSSSSSLHLIDANKSSEKNESSSSLAADLVIDPNRLVPMKLIRQPHSVNRLIDLPHDYSELVDKVSNFTCPSIKNEDSRTPTLCLVCGVMLCSQSYCCQRDLNNLAANYETVLKLHEEMRHYDWQQHMHGTSQASVTTTRSRRPDQLVLQLHGLGQVTQREAPQRNVSTTTLTGPPPPPPPNTFWFPAEHAPNTTGGGAGAQATPPQLLLRQTHEDNNRVPITMFVNHPTINQQLVGSCTYHAHECSGGVGVFLRIRNCQILLMSGRSKGCYMPAPYIDDHGETDFGLLRGNPLHLNRQHYERLQHLWLNHAIPEQISRTLEYSSYASNINWHLH